MYCDLLKKGKFANQVQVQVGWENIVPNHNPKLFHSKLKADVSDLAHYLRKQLGPSINYVFSKSVIFEPLPPFSRLFTK